MKTSKANRVAAIATAVAALKPDAKLANTAGRAERLVILDAINTADDLLGASLVSALKMTAEHGPTSKEEVAEGYTRCNNPDVYASTFNKGAKVAAIIGVVATLQLIDKAAGDGTGGAGYRKACDALGSVIAQAKTAGAKTLAPKAAKAAVTFAVKASADKSATRKAVKAAEPVVRSPLQSNLAKAALECGKGHKEVAVFLRHLTAEANKLPAPEGRETAHKEAMSALAEACDAWQVFAPKK